MNQISPKVRDWTDKLLEIVDCRTLMGILGTLSVLVLLRTAVVAGQGGGWGIWLVPLILLLVALAFLGLALTLAARTWVRLNEPQLMANRRAAAARCSPRPPMACATRRAIPVSARR